MGVPTRVGYTSPSLVTPSATALTFRWWMVAM